MRPEKVRLSIVLVLTFLMIASGFPGMNSAHAAGPTGSFSYNPQYILAGGNDSFTGIASGGTPPFKYNWTFGDGSPAQNGNFTTHIFNLAGSYTVTLNITDATTIKTSIIQTVVVHGSPLNLQGWTVNWNITAHHGVEIYKTDYNGALTIQDGLINGVLVRYFQQPPGLSCIFFDDLGSDDLRSSIAGLSVQFASDNSWFEIRANLNPSGVGYNYTELWRFYQSGRWDAMLYVGHLGCGWNHYYQPHFRISLAIGNKKQDLMSQYAPSGNWQNLIWEGNYTDNGSRDYAHNSTQWRFGNGQSYYYMVPTIYPWAGDMPKVPSKIYLVRDRPGELEPDINPPNNIPDPIIFANGELAYRQSIALWWLPTFGDHWLQSPGSPPIPGVLPSLVDLAFYPSQI